MKTGDLINLLATGDTRVDRKAALRRFARAQHSFVVHASIAGGEQVDQIVGFHRAPLMRAASAFKPR